MGVGVAADEVFLIVDGAEEGVSAEPDCEDGEGLGGGEVDGVAGEVLRLEGVGCGEEGAVTPGEVEAEVVVGYIDGFEVPAVGVSELDWVGWGKSSLSGHTSVVLDTPRQD